MADTGKEATGGKKKGGVVMGLVVPLVVLTLLAGGGGALIGMQIVSAVKASVQPAAAAPKPAEAAAQQIEADSVVKELTPIVTNLAAPDRANWIRLQAAIVCNKADAPQLDLLAAKISDDLLAFVRTLTVEQLQGASGFQHLREDLAERASIRSDGHVRDLLIEMMVVQ